MAHINFKGRRPIVAQGVVLTMSASSQQIGPFTLSSAVRISCTQPAWYLAAADPTAVATGASVLLPAGVTEEIEVPIGQKIGVLQAGSAGLFHAVPLT